MATGGRRRPCLTKNYARHGGGAGEGCVQPVSSTPPHPASGWHRRHCWISTPKPSNWHTLHGQNCLLNERGREETDFSEHRRRVPPPPLVTLAQVLAALAIYKRQLSFPQRPCHRDVPTHPFWATLQLCLLLLTNRSGLGINPKCQPAS